MLTTNTNIWKVQRCIPAIVGKIVCSEKVSCYTASVIFVIQDTVF